MFLGLLLMLLLFIFYIFHLINDSILYSYASSMSLPSPSQALDCKVPSFQTYHLCSKSSYHHQNTRHRSQIAFIHIAKNDVLVLLRITLHILVFEESWIPEGNQNVVIKHTCDGERTIPPSFPFCGDGGGDVSRPFSSSWWRLEWKISNWSFNDRIQRNNCLCNVLGPWSIHTSILRS